MSKTQANFSSSDDGGRDSHRTADDKLPVKNMTDWGCTADRIKAPVYSDRAYELCSQEGNEEFMKIKGQVHNIRTPTMLAKQKLHKDPWQSQSRIKSTPGEMRAPLKGPLEAPQRPFAVARKKKR